MTEQTNTDAQNTNTATADALKCCRCGCVCDDDAYFNDEPYCQDCFEEYVGYCEGCGNYYYQDDLSCFQNALYCDDCLCDISGCCEGCGERYHNDDLYYCDNCDCSYCEGCRCSCDDDDCDDCGYDGDYALKFEKIKSKTFKENKFKDFCGIEIECLNDNFHNNSLGIAKLKEFGFSQTTDSSLGNKGIEFYSLAFNGDELYNRIDKIINTLNSKDYYINSSCGTHIHIETAKTLKNIKKIILFYKKYEDYFFKMVSQSRQNHSLTYRFDRIYNLLTDNAVLNIKNMNDFDRIFYKSTNQKRVKYYKKQKYNHNRYCWVNLHSLFFRGTLEIRLHNGTLNKDKIKNWFNIHLTALNFIKNLNEHTINQLPKTEDFFLSLFDNKIQDYIKSRWAEFNNEQINNNEVIN